MKSMKKKVARGIFLSLISIFLKVQVSHFYILSFYLKVVSRSRVILTVYRKTMETVSDSILGGSKITADDDCSHEIKRHLLLGRKAMTNLDSILKSRDNTLLTKVRVVKAMVFPVVMYGCESLTVKKVEHQKIDAFELWCWRRLFRVPWTVRDEIQPVHPKGDQYWVFIGRTDAEAETPIFWPPHAKS